MKNIQRNEVFHIFLKLFMVVVFKETEMTREEIFKKNFPQYVTEKGVCLSPFWDLFDAGIEAATFELNKGVIQVLTKENAELRRIVNLFKAGYDEDGHYMLWFENVLEQADRFLEECDLEGIM